jgi:hypothetical protein
MSDEKIIKRDDKLLKNEKIIRLGRIIIIFIVIIQIALFIYQIKIEHKKGNISFIVTSLFIAGINSLQLNHIDSIKLYRSKINNQ